MPLPYLSNKPGPGRPGWSAGTYDFQFEVTGAVTIKAQPAAAGTFTIKWPDQSEVTTTGSNSIPAPNGTPGIVSINKKTDTTYCDEFAVVGGQTNVSKVLSWGSNPWTTLSSAFLNCTNLTDISTTSLITGSGCALSSAFKSCTSLTDVNISSWDMTNAAVIDEMFRLCTGLEVFQASSLHVNGGSRWWLRETGTAVTDGCEYRFNGLNITSTSFGAGNMTQWWYGMKINPASSFANISWPSIAHAGADFQNSSITGVNSTLDCSGWTNYNSGVFPKFSSFTATEGGTSNMKIDITNLNVSTVVSFNRSFMSSHISEIIGLGGLGATAGVINAEYAFLSASYMKFTNHNFSSAFINSFNLGSSNFLSMFNSCGFSLAQADAGSPPNLHSLNLSSATSLVQSFYRSRFSTAPDFSNVTMSPTAAYNLSGCFHNMALSDNSNVNSLFSKTFKVSNFTSTFSTTTLPSIIIGNGVDFSSCTTMTRMFQNATATDVQLPTNMDLGNMTGVNSFQYSFLSGPTLSTCQVDNFIRRLHATALTNGLAIDFNNAAVTESPSVVQSLESELTTNGWSITVNSTDATIPFEYPNFVEPGVATAPTNNTGGAFTGTFSSSDPTNIPVNSETGVINTTNTGNATIRYTLSDGCYTEQAILVASPFTTSWNIDSDFVNQTFYFRRATQGTNNDNTYFDYQIDWGDGSAMESFTDNTTPNHTYTSAGTYDIKVVGMIPGMTLAYRSGNQLYFRPEAEKLLEIKKWGDCKFSSFYYGFGGCKNMTITATDDPTFRQAGVSGSMNYFLYNCRLVESFDFSPWQTMLESIATGGMQFLCTSMSKLEYVKIPSCTLRNTGSTYHESLFQNVGLQAGIEILNAGSGLSVGNYTTTDTGSFTIRVNEVDSNGSAVDGAIGIYNADGWTENAVFNFTGGLQVKLTKARPGCDIIMKDITWSTRPLIRNLMYNAVVDDCDLSGWTFPEINTMQNWFFINNANYQQMTVNMDNWTTTGNGITSMRTMMLGNRSNKYPFMGPKILKTTNWDSSVTENLTSFDTLGNTADSRSSRLREWWGLDQIKIGKVTTFTRLFENMNYIIFSSQNGRNFSNNCFSNRVSAPSSMSAQLMCSNMSKSVDFSQESNAEIINLSGWSFDAGSPCSLSQAFYQSNHPGDDTTASGGVWWDLSSTDMSNINSLSSAFRDIGRYPSSSPYGNRPTEKRTVKINDLSSTLTTMTYLGQYSTITDWDLTGCDLSNVTSLERVFSANINRQSPKEPYTFTYSNTGNLNSVTNGVSFVDGSTPLRSSDYDNILRALGSTSVTNGDFRSGVTTYDGGLIFPDGRTPEQMTDTTTANKVVDENKNFVELGVSVGDIVESRRANSSPIVYASITAVSETELTLSASIIVDNNYRYYNIQTSDAAKDRFALDVTNSWYIADGGPTIE